MQLRQIIRAFRTNAPIVPEVEFIPLRTLSLRSTGPVIHGAGATVYGVNVAINALLGNAFGIVPTDGVAFQIDAPTNPPPTGQSQSITIKITNTFGVLGVATFEGGVNGYRIAPAWVQPAIGFSRTVRFDWDFSLLAWIETARIIVDIPN